MRSSYQALYDFGYSFLSPILNHYVRHLEQYHSTHRPVCLAREGWIFFKLLNQLESKGLIEFPHKPIYLKVSRTLLFRSHLGDPETWDIALQSKFKGTVLDLLKSRFGLQLHEAFGLLPQALLDFNLTLPDDKAKVIQWLTPHKSRLQDYVTPTRMALLHYFEQEKLLGEGPTAVMLDLGYAGTIQKLITKIISKDTLGLYFIASKAGDTVVSENTARMEGVFKENVDWSQGYLMLERSLLLESLMTAPHGQVVDIRLRTDNKLDFFYGRNAAPQRYFQDLETVMQGAIDGVEEAFRAGVEYSVDEVEALYAGFALSPSAIPRAAFHLFSIDDDFSGNGVINPTQLFGL
ncbi:HAD family hydrolase [Pseudomonas syringae]|uniref:HAD family hydrolase n=1 Tax=Pseudomonas syringae TaxID=317 RepID=UPI003F7A2101